MTRREPLPVGNGLEDFATASVSNAVGAKGLSLWNPATNTAYGGRRRFRAVGGIGFGKSLAVLVRRKDRLLLVEKDYGAVSGWTTLLCISLVSTSMR